MGPQKPRASVICTFIDSPRRYYSLPSDSPPVEQVPPSRLSRIAGLFARRPGHDDKRISSSSFAGTPFVSEEAYREALAGTTKSTVPGGGFGEFGERKRVVSKEVSWEGARRGRRD